MISLPFYLLLISAKASVSPDAELEAYNKKKATAEYKYRNSEDIYKKCMHSGSDLDRVRLISAYSFENMANNCKDERKEVDKSERYLQRNFGVYEDIGASLIYNGFMIKYTDVYLCQKDALKNGRDPLKCW